MQEGWLSVTIDACINTYIALVFSAVLTRCGRIFIIDAMNKCHHGSHLWNHYRYMSGADYFLRKIERVIFIVLLIPFVILKMTGRWGRLNGRDGRFRRKLSDMGVDAKN